MKYTQKREKNTLTITFKADTLPNGRNSTDSRTNRIRVSITLPDSEKDTFPEALSSRDTEKFSSRMLFMPQRKNITASFWIKIVRWNL